jgi:hypothetical protein
MNSENFSLVFLFVMALGVFGLFKIYKSRTEQRDKPLSDYRARRAMELGWRYQGTYEGDIRYRFSGNTATVQQWMLRYDSDASSSNSRPKIIWKITTLKAKRIEFGYDDSDMPLFEHVVKLCSGIASKIRIIPY